MVFFLRHLSNSILFCIEVTVNESLLIFQRQNTLLMIKAHTFSRYLEQFYGWLSMYDLFSSARIWMIFRMKSCFSIVDFLDKNYSEKCYSLSIVLSAGNCLTLTTVDFTVKIKTHEEINTCLYFSVCTTMKYTRCDRHLYWYVICNKHMPIFPLVSYREKFPQHLVQQPLL